MMDSPIPSALICISYVIFVFVGQRVMKDREPFKLKKTLIFYNFFMVALSGYIFFGVKLLNYFILKFENFLFKNNFC